MSQDQVRQFLMQGIEAAKAGQRDQARGLFQNAIRLDPQNETAWLWMSSVARDNRERLFCLTNLIQINPQNEMAQKGLRAMGVDPAEIARKAQEQAQAPATTAAAVVNVPALAREKADAIINAVDLFVRNYNPIPPAPEDIEWIPKSSRRYGESLAIRRRNRRFVLVGGSIAAVIIAIFIALLVLLGGGEQVQVAQRATLTPTFTPTNTATATPGVTNTPSPAPQRTLPPTSTPANLPKGNIYNNTPTAVYPILSSGLGREFAVAVGLYSTGRYDDAFVVFRRERDSRIAGNFACEPATYYYEILGLAEIGGRRSLQDARSLYEDALGRPGCDESPMIYTGACVTDYLTFLDSGDVSLYDRAVGWCDAAVDELDKSGERIIPVTATTRARLYMLEQPPNFRAAAAILDEALSVWPADLNLLLVRARVEINRGDLQEALRFISQGLFVDPASEQALRLRVEAYLDIAGQINDPQQKILLYGTAVIWTQEYLIFYPGEPAGYLLMARARLGEGNNNLAEEALDRIINVEDTLPDTDAVQETLARAHVLRADLYKNSGRYEQALDEIDFMLQNDPENIALIREQTDLAYTLQRYNLTLEGITALMNAGIGGEESTRLQLLQLRLTTQICEFSIEVECDYQSAVDTLTDDYIATLSEAQARDARSYRAIATYHLTMDADENTLNQNQRTLAYQQALADLDLVLSTDENPVNIYYRGLILQQLEETDAAVRNYEWLEYWSKFYDYPFMDDVQARLEELRPAEEDAT